MTKQTSSSISLRCDIYESRAGRHQFNLSALADSDNDGMVCQDGNIYYSNPQSPDSDFDTLTNQSARVVLCPAQYYKLIFHILLNVGFPTTYTSVSLSSPRKRSRGRCFKASSFSKYGISVCPGSPQKLTDLSFRQARGCFYLSFKYNHSAFAGCFLFGELFSCFLY